MRKLMTGAHAAAYAMKQLDLDVVAAYPITPQSPVVEKFAQYVADGLTKAELVLVESEHSAMSVCVGASAAGARVATASASQGLALMFEILYVAAGLRLPILMNVGNRALSAPINIHCDHSDTFPLRDSGWMQLYNENVQEVYDSNIIGMRLAEEVNLPIMVMQDGFYTTHSLQNFESLEDEAVNDFLGEKKERDNLLGEPTTIGIFALQDVYFETRILLHKAMEMARKKLPAILKEFYEISGREYGWFEAYKVRDADLVFVVVNSTAGAIREAVNYWRKKGEKVGMLKIRFFRPFPYKELAKLLKGKKVVVLDRNLGYGHEGSPLFLELKASIKADFYNVVYGLGGRDFYIEDGIKLIGKFLNKKQPRFQFYGYRKELLK